MKVFLLLLTCWLQGPQTLYLKNGKKIACEAYQVAEGRVTVRVNGQSLSLPESAVDWPRTEAAAETASSASAETPPKKKSAGWTPKKPDEPVALTNDQFRRLAVSERDGPITVNYQKWGNSIVVKARLNGRGPYRFILDTGAAMTIVSPAVAVEVDAKPTGESVNVVGVAGRPMAAGTVTLGEVSLGGGKVSRLRAAVQGIAQLNDANVAGLLGQDFLNHFVFELNSANRTITLEPHGAARLTADLEMKRREALASSDKTFHELLDLGRRLGGFYQGFMAQTAARERSGELADIKTMTRRLPSLRSEVNALNSALREIPAENLTDQDRQNAAAFNNCYPKLNRYMREAQRFLQVLRKAYSQASREDFADAKPGLRDDWGRLLDTIRELERCR